MDVISSIQHSQISELFRQWKDNVPNRLDAEATPPPIAHHDDVRERKPDIPSRNAFMMIGLLNISPFLHYAVMKCEHHIKTVAGWDNWRRDSFLGRWIGPTLERWDYRDDWIKTRMLGLSPGSDYLTWITSGFVHANLSHLVSNMTALAMYASICTREPGMSPSHVGAVTIGSSICGSAAQLPAWHIQFGTRIHAVSDRRVAIGASGIVSAFAALAAAAVPMHRLRIPILDVSAPVRSLVAIQVLTDVVGLFKADDKLWRHRPSVGHAAHLGGALFGALYYYIVLRHVETKTPDEFTAMTEDDTVSVEKEED